MKPKILFITDCPWAPTGYGRVVDNFIKYNSDAFEIHVEGLGHFGNPIDYHGAKVHSGGKDVNGVQALPYLIKRIRPDFVITLCDVGYIEAYKLLKSYQERKLWRGKWIAYVPIDALNIVPSWQKPCLEMPDVVVSMSEHGQKMIELMGIKCEYVPHGVDVDLYKPLGAVERRRLREKYQVNDKFVILSVGRNQVRKSWDRLLKAVGIFINEFGHKDVNFLMHTDMRTQDKDVDSGFEINVLCDKYEITKNCNFTDPQLNTFWRSNVLESDLVNLYQLADVGIYSGAEGFGIPMLEQQACGRPVIAGNQTSAKELVGSTGKLVDLGGYHEMSMGVEHGYPDERKLAEALEFYYKNRAELMKDGRTSREFAETYDWKIVMEKWKEVLK